jgi:hypothetical protein
VLDGIMQSRVQLVIWRRALPQGLSAALCDWAATEPPSFDARVRPRVEDVAPCLAGLRAGPERTWLLEDMVSRAASLARLAGVEECRFTFGVVRGDQCRKFHVDRVRLRLITTYTGPGTEWIPESGVRRAALQSPAPCPESANRQIARDPRWVRRAGAGDVLVMKGAVAGSPGVVHRSPPIEAQGLLRVVLVVSAGGAPLNVPRRGPSR